VTKRVNEFENSFSIASSSSANTKSTGRRIL
jgi:hypothetical protein